MMLVSVLDRFADGILTLLAKLVTVLERYVESKDNQNRTVVQALPPEALPYEDAAQIMGVDVATVEHLIRTRKLPFVQHGSQRGRMILVEDCRQFLRENRRVSDEKVVSRKRRT